jgi:sarcosine oxidase subunit beta
MPIRYVDRPPRSTDLVVVGGGVVGAATAFHAARAGIRVVLVEARPRLATLTTAVAAGAYRLQFDDREELELVRRSVDLFRNFEDATGQAEYDLGLRERGYLWLTAEPAIAERQRASVDRLRTWGQRDVEILDGDAVRERWPWVSSHVLQARWRGADGFLDTRRLTHGLVAGAGCDVLTSAAVTGFTTDHGRITGAVTNLGPIACGAVAICAGPLSGPLAGLAGVDLPVSTVVRHKVVLPDVPEVDPDGPMTIDEDTGAHWRPADPAGAWLLFTDPTTPPSTPTMDVPTDHRFAFRLMDPSSPISVARMAPFWRRVWERGSDPWMLQAGQYTIAPDHRPLIGATGAEGLFVNTAYAGHGIMQGPAGGELCVRAIVDPGAPNALGLSTERRPRTQPVL